MTRRSQQNLIALAAGVLFGAGLALGGMTDPRRVLGFLDVGGRWDPSLVFVMVGALAVHALAYRLTRGRASPLFAEQFAVPSLRRIDRKLVAGAALFGVGWGLSGYCPGPAIVSLGSGSPRVVLFVVAVLAGMFVADKLGAARSRSSASGAALSEAGTAAEGG